MTSLANVFRLNEPTPVIYNGAHAIAQALDSDCQDLTLRFEDDIQPIFLSGDEIQQAYGTELTLTFGSKKLKATKDLTTKQQIEFHRIKKYIDEHFNRLGKGVIGSVYERQKTIDIVRHRENDLKGTSPATLARKIKLFNTDPSLLAESVKGIKPKNRQSKINKIVEDKARDFFDDYYLTREPVKRSVIYELFIKELKDEGFPDSQIPSLQTFYNWSKRFDPLFVIGCQAGPRELTRASRNAVNKIISSQILERVEADAVNLACGLVDANGKYLGTPTVFVLFDCYSRSVLGVHVQIGRGETAASVMDCYRHAFLPKDVDYGTENRWTQFGQPQTLIVDGGTAYKGVLSQSFLIQSGVSATVAPTGQGWYKPFVERFFGTVRSRFAELLPGYCGRINDKRRLERTIEEEATLTYEDFKSRLISWIVDEYHQTAHKGLGKRTPQSVWDEQALNYPPFVPTNIEHMSLPQGEVLQRMITGEHSHLGVSINNIRYNDREGRLKKLGMRLNQDHEKPTVTCNYNPNDISSISVVDPYTDEVFEVRNTEGIPTDTPYVKFKSERLPQEYQSESSNPVAKTRTPGDNLKIHERQKEAEARRRHPDIEVISKEDLLSAVQNSNANQNSAEQDTESGSLPVTLDEDLSGGYDYE